MRAWPFLLTQLLLAGRLLAYDRMENRPELPVLRLRVVSNNCTRRDNMIVIFKPSTTAHLKALILVIRFITTCPKIETFKSRTAIIVRKGWALTCLQVRRGVGQIDLAI